MSEQIHVIYREEPDGGEAPQWTAYSYPVSIYATGSSLAHVRDQFAEAAAFHFEAPELDGIELHEHLERPSGVIDGVFIQYASRSTGGLSIGRTPPGHCGDR